MTRNALAEAFDKAAEALAQVAHELRGSDPAHASVPAAEGAVPPQRSSAPAVHPAVAPQVQRAQQKAQESGFTRCPAHGTDLIESKFGGPNYCPSESDDPDENWTNAKGRCRVTARNAGAWLKQHPSAA